MTVTVDCPTCGRKTVFAPSNRWRPFCSERCRMIDLGAWASDGYSIPGNDLEPDGSPPDDDLGNGERPPRNHH
jgi:uncharacterized protein